MSFTRSLLLPTTCIFLCVSWSVRFYIGAPGRLQHDRSPIPPAVAGSCIITVMTASTGERLALSEDLSSHNGFWAAFGFCIRF